MKPQEVLIELKKPKGEKHIVYFSSETGNTKKFVDKLKINSSRIPIDLNASLEISQDYVLFLSYLFRRIWWGQRKRSKTSY